MSSPTNAQIIDFSGTKSAVAYVYSTYAALTGSTGFDGYDFFKVGFIKADSTSWLLVNPLSNPPFWVPLGGSAAAASASYVAATVNPGLPNERVLAAGANITLQDNGPGSTLVINASPLTGTTLGAVTQINSNTSLFSFGASLVSTSVGPLSISLPNPAGLASAGSVIALKDCQGSASINPFTVYPTAGAKIDGISGSYPYFVNFGTLKFFTDGLDWFTW